MRVNRRRTTVAATVLAAAMLGALGACSESELSGPRELVGAPLLDMTLGPSGAAVFPGGSGTINTTRDTLTLTITNLPQLPAGAVYQVLLVDSATAGSSNVVPVSGRLITTTRSARPVTRDSSERIVRTDTLASTAVIAAADTNQTFVYRITGPAIAANSHVVLAVKSAAQAAASGLSGATRMGFLYGRYRNSATATPTYSNPTLTFGSFAINSAARLPFNVSGQSDAAFYGDQIRVNLQGLVRPPVGFRYAGWLIDDRTNTAVRIGGLLTPVPENKPLDDADVGTGTYLSDVGILKAQVRGDRIALGNINFEDFTRFALLLEPIGSAVPTRPSAALVHAGNVPASVATRSAAPGKIFGTVTSASGKASNTTLFLAGPTTGTAVLVTNADASGAFRFRTVPTGRYRLYAIPFGDATARDSTTITIAGKQTAAGLVGDSVFVTLRVP